MAGCSNVITTSYLSGITPILIYITLPHREPFRFALRLVTETNKKTIIWNKHK